MAGYVAEFVADDCRVQHRPMELALEAVFQRLPECVFHAFTIPEYIELWNNAEGNAEVEVSVELKVGAQFSILARQGRALRYWVEGTYAKIEPGKRLEFRWKFCSRDRQWDSVVRVEFVPEGAGTLLRIVQSGSWSSEDREYQKRWWQQRVGRLKTLLA
jgi:uncharacterized protein YndB with AHSA1/START domain